MTAQEVENGTGSLKKFALSVRSRSREHALQATTLEQGLHIGCLIRQEGSVWRSGSTYIVSLTPDGRVLIHAKDMSLAGRLLNPLIYAEILVQLGVDPAALANLASPDPDARNGAFAAIFAALSQEPDGAFDATSPVPGLRPGIPGASGYASVYVSPNFRTPIVLLTGFDLGESHLVPISAETIDYGDPTITASDVVDRRTLKEFVTQAGNYMIEIQRSGDAAAASQARIALRDPNGPWRHGSVYLYVLDTVTNIITFHAAFPDRFESRPLVPTVRDAVTGEFILPQVIAAAKSSPDGGFVEYYFDDPTDDTDSADIPKVGYARQFASQIQRTDGTIIPVNIIVGSGFYGRAAPEAVAGQHDTVIESVLPQVMRAMTASTVDAVSRRIDAAGSAEAAAQEMSLGGASTLEDVLMANGQALANGTFDPGQLLAGSSFTLPLGAAETQGTGPLGNLTLWGSGDWRNISGGNSQSVDYDGSVLSANLGIDTRLSAELLAGVSLGRSRGTVDYTASGVSGELTTTVTSLAPYAGWQAPGGMSLWAMAGQGWGEVEIEDASGTQSSDLVQRMAAAGLSGTLVSSDEMISGGTTRLRVRGDAAFTETEVDGSGTIAAVELEAGRHRLMVEGSHTRHLESGALFTPSLEVGMRNDVGDGETGSGVEAGGGVRYADEATGLTVEGRARTVVGHSGDYEEWGVSGLVRLDPGAAGLGWTLGLAETRRVSIHFGLEATRWEPANDNAAPENRIGLNAIMRW
ncbi:MAG: autotransporter domain-containing protein [bacterium]|nr:autotransporter domain-containing protein [bacterium]